MWHSSLATVLIVVIYSYSIDVSSFTFIAFKKLTKPDFNQNFYYLIYYSETIY